MSANGKDTVGQKMLGFLRGGFIFLMTALVLAWLIWLLGDAKDTGPFSLVLQFGIPAWFGVNAFERFAPQRKNGEGGSQE